MSCNPQRLQDYLHHIVTAISRINRYTDEIDEVAFLQDEMVQDAIIRNFEVIGEACRNIERHFPEFASAHPELPLSAAYEMRNALAHGYFRIDLEILWRSIHANLPELHQTVVQLQTDFDQE
ncbi:MAG: HepT-like ribonuclease domain-containing protein [Beijerinckiaceae bacterium]